MDEYAIRTRNPHRRLPVRRRKHGTRLDGSFGETFVKQLLAAAIILFMLWFVKAVNTPLTNAASSNVRGIIGADYDFNSIYRGADKLVNYVKGSSLFNKHGAFPELQDDTVAAGTGKQKSTAADDTLKADTVETEKDVKGASLPDSTSVPEAEGNAIADWINSKYSFITPVDGVLSSSFGDRIHPIKQTTESHKGIDIEATKGSSIKAALGGEVIEAGLEQTYGNYIKIKHSDGIATVYAHCLVLNVKKGQTVKQGDVIAKVGDTGLSVGTHLHFEIWKDSTPVNPLSIIKVPLK